MRRGALLLSSLVALAGCGGGLECPDNRVYQASREEPPLIIPEGLDPPATEDALVIPPIPEDRRPRPEGVPACLQQPPSYFPDRPRPEV